MLLSNRTVDVWIECFATCDCIFYFVPYCSKAAFFMHKDSVANPFDISAAFASGFSLTNSPWTLHARSAQHNRSLL